ncbi:hypothetical protein M6K071_2556 [Staphylococcus aureus]|jgi:hypothetical protein|nr:hypothetical protein M1K005_2581 [Staphylococcus aureus]GBY58509.1 hypothetical protein M6K071_2556 [Staphylococcus aureus]GCA37244.1 hypothetical protein M6K227_2557 [Staphylococcus aureus]
MLPADLLHRFNFFTVSFKIEYLKLNIEVVPAYSNVKKPIFTTSGCPKNQNKCWNKIGSPPPATSKNDVLKFLSVKIIVIPPANTGNDNNNNTAVIITAQPNNANLCKRIPGLLIFNIVVMKFIAPNILLIPLKCKPKIAKSTLGPLCDCIPDKGG